MLFFHSCDSVHKVAHLLELVTQREDVVIYCTRYRQTDYGQFVVSFEVDEVGNDSYDQGGSSPTGNFTVQARSIRVDTMRVSH